MTSLSEIRARLRLDLGDPTACLWSDAELDRFIGRAVCEFSHASPRKLTATVPTSAGDPTISLAPFEGLVGVDGVEYPIDEFPPRSLEVSRSGNALLLHFNGPPAGADCRVSYSASHRLDCQTSTIPPQFDDLIIAGAAAHAALDGAQPEGATPDRGAGRARARLTAFRQLLHDHRPAVEVGGRTYRRPPDQIQGPNR